MTLRARLAIGLSATALVLLIPLFFAIDALRTAEHTARNLRDNDFAAALLLGRVRQSIEDIRAAENALLFVRDEQSRARMGRELTLLAAMADTLRTYELAESAELAAAVLPARRAAAAEYAAARAGRSAEAERISARTFQPALSALQHSLVNAEVKLRNRTQARVTAAAEATDAAQNFAAGALAVVAVLALAIGIWLMRSISRPIEELEQGMSAVAEGDFDYQLPFTAARRDEFGRLAASYDSMAHQLADLDRLKAEFMSVASHELKTPINVIIGYVQLLREGVYGELTPKQSEVCGTVEKQAQSLTKLVRQLLDVSRFEAGGGRIEPGPIKLAALIEQLESSFLVLARQRDIDFSVHCGPNLPREVVWDEDRINEVLGNLVSNALKFTDRGGRVVMTVDALGSEVRIEVSDTGVGIPKAQLPHVFEKFFQADNQAASPTQGTGLGLAIAQQIVEAHSGTITVNSTEGEGATFAITLPVKVVSGHIPGRQQPTEKTEAA